MPRTVSQPQQEREDVGLADILERGDLSRREGDHLFQVYDPSAFDLEILDVADSAVSAAVPTAVVLPVPGANTAVLLATCILVDHFCRHRSLTAQVALVTRQLRLRSFYDSLYFRREHVVDFFPRTLVTGGSPVDIGTRPADFTDRPGRLHFLPNIQSLADVGAPLDGVVIEAAAAEPGEVANVMNQLGRRVPLIYVTTNPFDEHLGAFMEKGAVWAWDAAWLTYLFSGEDSRATLCTEVERLRGACDTEFVIKAPESEGTLDKLLSVLWQDLVTVQKHTRGVTFDALKWVWGAYGALSHLSVPVKRYDEEAAVAWGATPLEAAAEKASLFASNSIDADQQDYWEVLAADLGEAIEAARTSNVKPQLLADWVGRCVEDTCSGLIVTRNRPAKEAIRRFLRETPGVPMQWQTNVEICTLSELHSGNHSTGYERALLTGPVASRYSSLLALPAAGEMTVLVHGQWESRRATNQIRSTLDQLARLAHGGTRQKALTRLGLEQFPDGPSEPKPLRITSTQHPVELAHTQAGSDPVWDPFDVSVVGSLGSSDEDTSGPTGTSQDESGYLRVVRIDFHDGVAFFEPDRLLTVVRGDTEEVSAKGLTRGDAVVLIDKGARRDLFDVITDRLAELPEFTATVELIRQWQTRALLAGARHAFDYATILDKMRPETRITTTQTIRNWVLSWVKGPGDPREIRIFGEAVGDQVLATKWEPIGRALKTLRAHHKKIGRMLGKVLSGISPVDLEDAGYFDRRLGIHFTDLVEAVTVHRVEKVADEAQTIPAQYGNHLLSTSEAQQLEALSNG
jgi:hypothetical protein